MAAKTLVSEYLGALQLYPVRLLTADTVPWAALLPGEGRRAPLRRKRVALVHRLYWCADGLRAALLADAWRDVMRARWPVAGEGFAAPPQEAVAAVAEASRISGVLAVPSERIVEVAEREVARAEQQLEVMMRAGALQNVNKAYREYRLRETAAGRPFKGYKTWIAEYLAHLVRAVAEHSRINLRELAGDMPMSPQCPRPFSGSPENKNSVGGSTR